VKLTHAIAALGCVGVCMITQFSPVDAIAAQSPEIHQVWSVDVDQRPPNAPIALSTPAVVNTADDTLLVLAARDKFVHVYNLEGDDVRRIAIEAPSDSGALLLSNGLVVVGDIDGRIYGIDPIAGVVAWQVQLTASFTNTPVALGDDFLVQTNDNFIYYFTAAGEKKWSYAGQNSVLSLYLSSTPLVAGNRIFAVQSNGDCVALKADSGDLLWKRQLLMSNNSSVLTEMKAPLATPLLLDTLNMNGESVSDVLLVPFYQGELHALSASDGSELFSVPTSIKSSPLLWGGMMYLADSEGYIHAYHRDKGLRAWSKKISSTELLGPVLWQERLWVADKQGNVLVLNADGEVQAQTTVVGRIARLPQVTTEGVVIRTERGVMVKVQ